MPSLPLIDGLAPARLVRHQKTARRLRLAVPELLGRPSLARRLERELLGAGRGATEVRADPQTGRVLLRYAPGAPLLDELVSTPRSSGRSHSRRAARGRSRQPVATLPCHALPVEELFERLEARPRGLDARAAGERLRRYGANHVEDGEPRSRLEVLRDQVANFPTLLLLGSSALSGLGRDFLGAGAILGTVGIDASMGYAIERKNERLLESWRRLEAGEARVIRDGRISKVAAADLVPGDVLVCRSGDTVPADARVIDAHRLTCDESLLTGESEACWKQREPVPASAPIAEHASMLFSGSRVVGGRGRALVVATGPATAAARIQRLIQRERAPETPFERRLGELGRSLSIAGSVAGVASGAVGLVRGQGVGGAIRHAIALGVAAIPEGLPLVATTGLVQSMHRMREQGMVVRRLVSAETLGGVTVVCCDKTGTLTRNEMVVEALDLGFGRLVPAELRAEPEKLFDDPATLALTAALLNSDVDVEARHDELTISGSHTERAIVQTAYAAGLDRSSLRRRYPRRHLRERDVGTHYVVSVHETPEGSGLSLIKGAPEQVLELCDQDLLGPLDDGARRRLLERNEALAADGMRVLALAWRSLPSPQLEGADRGCTLIGLIGLRDPLRPGADRVISGAARAGIRSVILTGDQLGTAEAVARAVGLEGPVVEGRELVSRLEGDPRSGRDLLRRCAAVARVDPADKAAIVRALREMGEIVAMAGDGINDAPALKAADVGIAIGAGATDVSRQAADIVLASEELSAVLHAVGEGRVVQDNLRRAVHYLVATNFAEVLMAVGSALGSRAQLLSPMRLLWLNLLSDAVPAMALALEPGRGDELSRPPAPPDAPIVNRDTAHHLAAEGLRMAGVGGLALITGGPAAAFSTLAGVEIGYAFACRSQEDRPDPEFLGLIGGTAVLHLVATALPPVRGVLGLSGGLSLAEAGGFCGGLLAPIVWAGARGDERIVRCGAEASPTLSKEDSP